MDIWVAETFGDGAVRVRQATAEEPHVSEVAMVSPQNIYFFAELTMPSENEMFLWVNLFNEVAKQVNDETGLVGPELFDEVLRRYQEKRWGSPSD